MADPNLLEIRIHGVRNTPAHEMLRVPAAEVLWGRGDASAGFSTTQDPDAHHRVEAYSWGLLARKTGLPKLGRAGDAVVRVLWFGLAPFGLVNAAFWSRETLLKDPAAPDLAGQGTPREQISALGREINSARGAGAIRLLGLLLTLLLVGTIASIAMRVDTGVLFQKFEILMRLNRGQELAAAGALCALVSGVLWLLPKLANISFHGAPHLGPDAAPGGGPASELGAANTPLARRYFWEIGTCTSGLAKNHLTAAFALVSGLLAVMQLESREEITWSLSESSGRLAMLGSVAVALLLVALVRSVAYRHPQAIDKAALVAGVAVLAAALSISARGDAPLGRSEPFDVTLTALILVVLVTLLAIWVQCRTATTTETPAGAVGWNGTGPFVFGSLATGFALLLSFAVVQMADLLPGGPTPPLVLALSSLGFVVLVVAGVVYLISARPTKDGPQGNEMADVAQSLQCDQWVDSDEWDKDRAKDRVWKSRRWTSLLRRAEKLAGFTGWSLFASTLFFVAFTVGRMLYVNGYVVKPLEKAFASEHVVRAIGAVGLWAAMGVILALVLVSAKKEARPVALLWDLMCFLPVQGHPFGPPCYSVRVAPELADRIGDWLDGADDRYLPAGSTEIPPERSELGAESFPERKVVIAAHSMGLVLAVCMLFHARAAGMADDQFKRIGILSYGVQVRRYFARFFPAIMGPEVLSIVPAGSPDMSRRDPWPIHPLPLVAGGEPEVGVAQVDAARATDAQNAAWALSSMIGNRWINLYRPNDPLGYGLHYVGGLPANWEMEYPLRDRRAEEFVRDAYQFKVAGHSFYLQTDAYAQGIEAVTARVNAASGTNPPAG